MNILYLSLHLGLGDAIICNGMIRELARTQAVIVPAKLHNVESVREMFEDTETIIVVPVRDDNDMMRKSWIFKYGLALGLHSGNALKAEWDKQMYEQARIPFEMRWSQFKCPKAQGTLIDESRIFVHDDLSRGFSIDKNRIGAEKWFKPIQTRSIWSHLLWLQTAPEIHVIDSCFLCLADSIETKAKRLVLHLYANQKVKPHGPPSLRKNWEILT